MNTPLPMTEDPQRYTLQELALFRGYLEWRRIYASATTASSIESVPWQPWMQDTLEKLREDTRGHSDWDRYTQR